jgi:5'(3')-deoxyribonucleotidase
MYSNKEVPPGFEKDLNNIAIDFDGVIHTFDKGFHDGTCYGDPIEGALIAIKELSKRYNIIIFTAKAKPDRPLVNNKTGTELVTEWLTKYGVMKHISLVTSEKPRAQIYIDDKGYHFTNWADTIISIGERL